MADIELRKIEQTDDIRKITDLIYDTDPYIYKDLLGEKQKALELIKILICDKKSYFYMDHFYGAFIDGKIVGIMSVIPNDYEWDFDSIRMAYMEIGEKMPASAVTAGEYLEKSFARIGLQSVACNICVDKEQRHKGVGNFLVQKIIEISGGTPIELCVIADNIPAVKLYTKHGFKIISTKAEYGGYNQPDILCHNMVRMPD